MKDTLTRLIGNITTPFNDGYFPKHIDGFRARIFSSDKSFREFMNEDDSIHFLSNLSKSGKTGIDLAADILSKDYAVSRMTTSKGDAEKVIDLMERSFSINQQARTLAAESATSYLVSCDKGRTVVRMMQEFNTTQRAQAMTTDKAVLNLAKYGYSAETVEFLKPLSREQQTQILCGEAALGMLCGGGQTAAIADIALKLEPEQQLRLMDAIKNTDPILQRHLVEFKSILETEMQKHTPVDSPKGTTARLDIT